MKLTMMSVAEYYDQRHRYNLSGPIYKNMSAKKC